jgi:hypothetical protein
MWIWVAIVLLLALAGVPLSRPLRQPENRRRAYAKKLIKEVVRTFPRDAENARATHRISDELERELKNARALYVRRYGAADGKAVEVAHAIDEWIWRRTKR